MVDSPLLTVADFTGRHNIDLTLAAKRLEIAKSYKELSTVCVIPNSGFIAAKVAEKWLGQISQMNQKFVRLLMIGMEKNYGFNSAIEQILAIPGLDKFKYLLTLEEDAIPPFDGILKLFEGMENFDVVGGLVYEKGIEGKPSIYGLPFGIPLNFTHVPPFPETLQPCLAVSTDFTLFKLDIFKDQRVPKPWFRTQRQKDPLRFFKDDMDFYFFENIHKLGYKVACDTRVKVGHYDHEADIVW